MPEVESINAEHCAFPVRGPTGRKFIESPPRQAAAGFNMSAVKAVIDKVIAEGDG
jgi:hypothetical protein